VQRRSILPSFSPVYRARTLLSRLYHQPFDPISWALFSNGELCSALPRGCYGAAQLARLYHLPFDPTGWALFSNGGLCSAPSFRAFAVCATVAPCFAALLRGHNDEALALCIGCGL
jgi:hypothetical protein